MSTKAPNNSQTQSVGNSASTEAEADMETETETEMEAKSAVTETEAETNVIPSLGPDRIFEVLKNQRRRRTLHYLSEHDSPVTIGSLAEHIAALENDTTQAALTSRERKRVYVGLYQCHLPKMDDTGAIEFNKARGTIALGPTSEQFEPYLEIESSESDVWPRYYLLLTGASGVLFGTNVFFEIGISLTQLLAGILVSFVLLSIAHLYSTPNEITAHLSSLIDR